MSEARWPAYQNMCSFRTKEDILKDHEYNLRLRYCPAEECVLSDWDEYSEEHCKRFPNTPRTHFKITWTSYAGWKTYMLHTGCLASIPEYEDAEQERIKQLQWEAHQELANKAQRDAQLEHLLGESLE